MPDLYQSHNQGGLSMAVNPIPNGFHTLTPYFVVKGANDLVEFLKKAFKAEEIDLVKTPDGSLMHGELRIGTSILMISEIPEGHTAENAMLYMYVEDVD